MGFLAYGIIGPLAGRLKQLHNEDYQFMLTIKETLVAYLHGAAIQVSVEIGRGAVPSGIQPNSPSWKRAWKKCAATHRRLPQPDEVNPHNRTAGQSTIKKKGAMIKFTRLTIVILFFLMTFALSARVQPYTYQDGLTAYDQGDLITAFKVFSQLANTGNADAQNRLGTMYLHGEGVEKNNETAFTWFKKSADQGYFKGQSNVGYMYYLQGTASGDAEAVKWYRMAADKGYDVAEQNMGKNVFRWPRRKAGLCAGCRMVQ